MQKLIKHRISGAPVVNENYELLGVISEGDCIKHISDSRYHNLPMDNATVGQNMAIDVETIDGNMNVFDAARFFIERKHKELINLLKQKVKNCYIPEEETSAEFQKPILVTALGKLTKFNILINNGVSHMLSFSQNKNFIFFNEQSEKWKPANDHTYVYNCKVNNTKIDKLSSDTIIEVLEKN